jgi:signal transduction histidine kinase
VHRKLTVALLALVIVPLGTLTWLGVRLAQDEQQLRNERMHDLLAARLDDADALATQLLQQRRAELRVALAEAGDDVAAVRRIPRELPYVGHTFLRTADGGLAHPAPSGFMTSDDRAFFNRTRALWEGSDTLVTRAENAPFPGAAAVDVDDGWYAWFWDSGLQLMYWRRAPGGAVVGAELDRVRLLADVVAELPVTDPADPTTVHDRIVLLDARGRPVTQWGRHEPAAGEMPRVERPLSHPLEAWQLQYYVSPEGFEAATAGSTAVGLSTGLAALGLAVVLLGLYFHRESSREIREAGQRVGFVNQVSHELKTPLTNIRMYAELLQRRVDPEDGRAQDHLEVIVSESQRLSRLIGNVLTFARQRRDAVVLRPAPACLDTTVEEVLSAFRPSLERRGVVVEATLDAPGEARFDADVVAQVVANLVSNVEKYAAGGGWIGVQTASTGGRAQVTVRDRGPGLPASRAADVFEPFVRLGDALTEGATGAGIGLALARDLARLHGGDLVLEPTETGTRFRFEFELGPTKEA